MKACDLLDFLNPYVNSNSRTAGAIGGRHVIEYTFNSDEFLVFLCRDFGDVQLDTIEYDFETQGCQMFTVHRGVNYKFNKLNNFTLRVYKHHETSNENN